MTKDSLRLPSAFCAPAELAKLPPETPVLLAFSGGADSRALLHMLAMLAKERGFRLTLAHVEHGIRGDASRRDLAFCRMVASQYGLEICTLSADVPALAKERGRGLEETAREVRYAFFDRLMREKGIPLLATAHHADDQAETMLFRLCRGTGLGGLSGIAPVRPFSVGMLTRPLLHLSKQEILNYCAEHQLEFVTDATNLNCAYARNRLRAQVLPVMEELFEGSAQRISATADALREDARLLDEMAAEALARASVGDGLSLDALRAAPTPICRRMLIRWIADETGRTPERVHINAVMNLLFEDGARACAALSGGTSAVAEFGRLRLILGREERPTVDVVPLREGETLLGNTGIRVLVQKNTAERKKVHNSDTEIDINLNIDSAMIERGLFWRFRRDGDRLLMNGMHKRLRRLLRAAGIPPRLRDRIPLLCDGDGIVWVPYVGLRDHVEREGISYRVSLEMPEIPLENAEE
ncbi:MAG: tRNA lysidine(34) synthetase TilS [Clostridia bacterium]|nr:tRNA lysidine(34) synthetase TilS [Clostridia bacterium]